MGNKKYKTISEQQCTPITQQTEAYLVVAFIQTRQYQKLNQQNDKFPPIPYQVGTTLCFDRPKQFYIYEKTSDPKSYLVVDEKNKFGILNFELPSPDEIANQLPIGSIIKVSRPVSVIDAFTHLPMFVVYDRKQMTFIQNQPQRPFPTQKYRELAKLLFDKDPAAAQKIYFYLVQKDAEGLQVIYSNIGLVKYKLGETAKAIEYYKKSLEIKPFQKSQFRLASLYLEEEKYQNCEQITKQIKNQKYRQSLLKKIKAKIEQKQKSEKLFSQQNFIKIQASEDVFFRKKNPKKKKIIIPPQVLTHNPSARKPLNRYVMEFFRQQLQIPLYNIFCLNLGTYDPEKFFNLFNLAYGYAELPIRPENYHYLNLFQYFAFFILRAYGFKFGNAYTYFLFYSNFFKQINLNQPIKQFLVHLSLRCIYVEEKFEKQCHYLQNLGENHQEILKLCEMIKEINYSFCEKKSQILFQEGRHQENSTFSVQMLKKCTEELQNTSDLLAYASYFANQALKSFIQLKEYQLALKWGSYIEKILQQVPRTYNTPIFNSNCICDTKQYHRKMRIMQNSIIPSISRSEAQIQNNIAICYYQQKKYDLAMKKIDQNLKKIKNIMDEQFYFQTVMIKIKILKKKYGEFSPIKKVFLEKTYQEIVSLNKNVNLTFFRCVILKLILNHEINDKNISKIVAYVGQVFKLQPKYAKSLIDKLNNFVVSNLVLSVKLIKQMKADPHLQVITERVQQTLRRQSLNTKKHTKKNLMSKIHKQKVDQLIKGQIVNPAKTGEQNSSEIPKINANNLFFINKELEKEDLHILDKNKISPKQIEQKSEDQINEEQLGFQNEENENTQQNEQMGGDEEEKEMLRWREEKKYWDQYQGFEYITNFRSNGKLFIVYFCEKIKFERDEKNRFILSAQKICKRNIGHNGIKIKKNEELRLKIHAQARLIGKRIKSCDRNDLLFTKLQGHDNYKRRGTY